VIVLGDIVEDAHMVRDECHETVLRIGYLNKGEKEREALFRDTFDMVISGDGTLAEVNDIIRQIV